MAISASYVIKETGNNLRRNLVMTIGAMLTGAVSLALMGGVLLSRQAVNKQTAQWKGGVELSIFMQPDASQSQIAATQPDTAPPRPAPGPAPGSRGKSSPPPRPLSKR